MTAFPGIAEPSSSALSEVDRELLHMIYSGQLYPEAQVEAFEQLNCMFPTRTISRGTGASHPLSKSSGTLPPLSFDSNGRTCDLYDYVSRNRCVGLLILKKGRIVLEYHGLGHDSASRWMSMSMAKSVTSLLVGCAILDGDIRSLDDDLVEYLPPLAGSAFEGVSIRHLLQMTSGVRWNEEYTDSGSDRRRMLDLQASQESGAILSYMAGLPRVAEPGSRWNYSTGETHVAGALVHAATGKWLSNYLSEKLWSRLGMDHDATWWLEAPDGLEVAGSGMRATLRDYARLGQFVCLGGTIDSEPVVPKRWVAESGACAECTVGIASVPVRDRPPHQAVVTATWCHDRAGAGFSNGGGESRRARPVRPSQRSRVHHLRGSVGALFILRDAGSPRALPFGLSVPAGTHQLRRGHWNLSRGR
jgi:hypothetical protein